MGIQRPANLKGLTQEVSSTLINLDFADISIERALGILWNPGTDPLQIKVTAKDAPLTKRGFLSYTSWIFNPLGILVPIILELKLIIQSLWKQTTDWDSEIPTDLKQRFLLWKEKLQSWDVIQIPRWYGLNSSTDAELHIFMDASTFAYGAVACFRYNKGNDTRCSFIMSKSCLAPIKENTLTVPKLELQAAVMACRMKNVILDEIKLGIKFVHFWCDSKAIINYWNKLILKQNFVWGWIIVKVLTNPSKLKNEKRRNYFTDIIYRMIMKVRTIGNLC